MTKVAIGTGFNASLSIAATWPSGREIIASVVVFEIDTRVPALLLLYRINQKSIDPSGKEGSYAH